MRFFLPFGGGLGDLFWRLYHGSEYQAAYLLCEQYEFWAVDLTVNKSSKELLESLSNNETRIFKNVLSLRYANFTPDRITSSLFEDDDEVINAATPKGWDIIRDIIPDRFFNIGYGRETCLYYEYLVSYQEQQYLDTLKHYIVIHPYDGQNRIRALSNDEITILIQALIDNTDYNIVVIGKDNATVNPGVRYPESKIEIEHPRFINLLGKTSSAMCANVVKDADVFIGNHSCWVNFFWYFNKPSICLLPPITYRGGVDEYIKTDPCGWGFQLKNNRVIVNESIEKVCSDVLKEIRN